MSEPLANGVISSGHASTSDGRHAPAPWQEALLAGLPYAFWALIALTSAISHGLGPTASQVGQVVKITLGGAFALSLVAALVFAWRRGWPHWSASWIGYVGLLGLSILGLALQALGAIRGDWWKWRASDIYLYLVVPFLLAIALYILALRDRLKFLLVLLPFLLLLWTLVLEFSVYPLRDIVTSVAWLGAALVATLIARTGQVRTGIWMALALSLAVGLTFSYTGTHHRALSPGTPIGYRSPPTFLDWLNLLIPTMLTTSLMLLEPLLLRRLRSFGQHTGTLGKWGFRLSAVGLFLLLAKNLVRSWWSVSGATFIRLEWGYEASKVFRFSLLEDVALIFYLAGAILFGVALVRIEMSIKKGTLLLLAFVLAIAPLTPVLPIINDSWHWPAVSQMWLTVAGLPWIALGAWLVSRRGVGSVSGAEGQPI